jgi:hypothetical protein
MVRVINREVIQTTLPSTGYLSNGESVSGYNLLPESVLKAEGWLPLEENRPEYNAENETLELDNYTIEADKVTANYKVIPLVSAE